MNYDNYKFSQYENQHAETRWATVQEIQSTTKKINLKDDHYPYAGVPMMNDGESAYIDDLDNHSLVFGSTGSKKTRLFCMPTLNIVLKGGESFVATDPKGELYAKTSGLAKELGYNIIVLNFRDLEHGDCWNPLSMPYKLYKQGDQDAAISRLNDFIDAISEKQMNNSKDIFWITAAKSVALAVLITMLDCCTEEECNIKTFSQFCSAFSSGTADPFYAKACGATEDEIEKNYLTEIMNLAAKDSIARLNYDGLASSSDKARGDIQGTLFTLISTFLTQETLARNLSNNTFNVKEIGSKKTAVYIIIPDERTNYHFIATTFIKQCYESLIILAQEQENLKLPIKVNFILDEFANIPKIPDMSSMISAGRSRDLKFFLVLQSMHQLKSKYGESDAQTIKGNCENWIFLASKELELLNEISELAGKIERNKGNYSESVPLISVSQLQRLDKQSGEALIFCARHYPFISKMADIDDCAFPKLASAQQQKIENLSVVSISPEELYLQLVESKRNLPFKNIAKNGLDVRKKVSQVDFTPSLTPQSEVGDDLDEMLFDKYRYRPYLFDKIEDIVRFNTAEDKSCYICISRKADDEFINPTVYIDDEGYIIFDSYNYPLMIFSRVSKSKYIDITTAKRVVLVFKDENPDLAVCKIYQEFDVELEKNNTTTKSAELFKMYDDNFNHLGLTNNILYNEIRDVETITDKCSIETDEPELPTLYLNKAYDEQFKDVDVYLGKKHIILFKQHFPVVILKNVGKGVIKTITNSITLYVHSKKSPTGFLSSQAATVIKSHLIDDIVNHLND